MDRVALIGIIRIELPDADIRLCDGGFVTMDGLTYQAEDPIFGTIGALEAMSEGVGDEVPAGKLTFIIRDTAAAATLSKPGYQNSRMRFWIAEFDEDTGAIIGTPDLMMEAQTDRTVLKRGQGTRVLEMEFVSRAERLFQISEGNTLTDRFHQSVFPDETGFANAIGVPTSVAWGVEAPRRGVTSTGGGTRSVGSTIYEATRRYEY